MNVRGGKGAEDTCGNVKAPSKTSTAHANLPHLTPLAMQDHQCSPPPPPSRDVVRNRLFSLLWHWTAIRSLGYAVAPLDILPNLRPYRPCVHNDCRTYQGRRQVCPTGRQARQSIGLSVPARDLSCLRFVRWSGVLPDIPRQAKNMEGGRAAVGCEHPTTMHANISERFRTSGGKI